jgi:hypothetical protein
VYLGNVQVFGVKAVLRILPRGNGRGFDEEQYTSAGHAVPDRDHPADGTLCGDIKDERHHAGIWEQGGLCAHPVQ